MKIELKILRINEKRDNKKWLIHANLNSFAIGLCTKLKFLNIFVIFLYSFALLLLPFQCYFLAVVTRHYKQLLQEAILLFSYLSVSIFIAIFTKYLQILPILSFLFLTNYTFSASFTF